MHLASGVRVETVITVTILSGRRLGFWFGVEFLVLLDLTLDYLGILRMRI